MPLIEFMGRDAVENPTENGPADYATFCEREQVVEDRGWNSLKNLTGLKL
jgi:hypothetical protein